MSIFAPVTWLWTPPHQYGRPWAWTIFVIFLTVFFFLRWQAWFTAVIHARLFVEFVLCYRDLKRRTFHTSCRTSCPASGRWESA